LPIYFGLSIVPICRVEDIDEANKTIRVKGKGSKYRMVPFMSDSRIEPADQCPEALQRVGMPLPIVLPTLPHFRD